MDKIQISGLPLPCRIGVSAEERAREQEVLVDVELFLDLQPTGKADELSLTIDYEKVCETLQAVATQQPYCLIETLAETMASAILQSFPAMKTRVRIKKPGALAHRKAAYAAVEIVRDKNA